MAAKQAARPTCRPADRSVPLVIRHPDTPQAMMNLGATLEIRLPTLSALMKFWLLAQVTSASRMIRKMIA